MPGGRGQPSRQNQDPSSVPGGLPWRVCERTCLHMCVSEHVCTYVWVCMHVHM